MTARTPEQKARKAAYAREWRRRNPDKYRLTMAKYWMSKIPNPENGEVKESEND